MIFLRGVKQEEVEDILETWLKVRSWVIFQWGVSEEREREIKRRGWDGSPALSFRFGDLYKGLFPEALEFSRRYAIFCWFVSSGVDKVVFICLFRMEF